MRNSPPERSERRHQQMSRHRWTAAKLSRQKLKGPVWRRRHVPANVVASALPSELRELLDSQSRDSVLGHTLGALMTARRLAEPPVGLDAVVMKRLVDTFPGEEVWIEETRALAVHSPLGRGGAPGAPCQWISKRERWRLWTIAFETSSYVSVNGTHRGPANLGL